MSIRAVIDETSSDKAITNISSSYHLTHLDHKSYTYTYIYIYVYINIYS